MVHSRRVEPFSLAVALVAAIGALASGPAGAGSKPHCRDLTFDGAAGAASNDKVTVRVVDNGGGEADRSCQLQVKNNETAKDFAARLVGAWGVGDGITCPPEPNPLPKKSCGNGVAKSCNHKFKFKPDKTTLDPNDGLILVRVCCFDAADCKGAKLVATPVSVQTKVDPAVSFTPTVPPPVGITATPVALDPIGLTQRPFAALQTCRGALGEAAGKLAVAASAALVTCHGDVMQGVLPATTDCNGLTPASDPAQHAEAAAAGVRAVATGLCAAGGQPPSNVGYADAACPCPCQHVLPNTCAAGQVGAPCASDAECDLPGAGGGHCALAGWSLAAECAVCLAEAGVTKAIAAAYGVPGPGPGLPQPVQACEVAVGNGLAGLVRVHVVETASCQKAADAGKLGLPTNLTCRDADPKARRAAAEAKTAATIAATCPAGILPFGCVGTSDPTGCVLTQARTAAASASGAAYPELRLGLPCSPGGAFLDGLD